MNAARFIDIIPDYLEGDLPPADRLAFEAHLQSHPEDNQYFNDYKAVIDLCQSAYDEEEKSCCENLVRCTLSKISALRSGHDTCRIIEA